MNHAKKKLINKKLDENAYNTEIPIKLKITPNFMRSFKLIGLDTFIEIKSIQNLVKKVVLTKKVISIF